MSRSAGEEQGGMSPSIDILDSLLPLLQPEGRELHLNAAIVKVAEPAQLTFHFPVPRTTNRAHRVKL